MAVLYAPSTSVPSPSLRNQSFYNNSRCANSRNKRTHQRGPVQNGSINKTPPNARVESEAYSSTTVPSGSVESTTVPRRGFSSSGSCQKSDHRNVSPHSSIKASRKRGKAGESLSATTPNGCSISLHPAKVKLSTLEHARGNSMTLDGTLPSERKTSSAVDSGHGDELSSSGESDFHSQPSVCQEDSLSKVCELYTSSSSDVEDDVFQDALSNLPSEDEHCNSSTSTSAFVTPLSTRSQSPSLPLADFDSLCNSKEDFIYSLTNSLNGCITNSDGHCNPHCESSGMHTGTVAIVPGPETISSPSCTTCTLNGSESDEKNQPKKRMNGIIQANHNHLSVSPEGELPARKDTEHVKAVSSRNRRNKKTNDNVSFNPKGKKMHSLSLESCDKHLSLNHTSDKPCKSMEQNDVEISSISSASPASSVCSHSPQTFSPSPTSSINSFNKDLAPKATNLRKKPKEDSQMKDEWPDLGMEFSISPKAPKPAEIHSHLEIEAGMTESLLDPKAEEDDSGCNMSIGSSNESSFSTAKHQQPETVDSTPFPMVMNNALSSSILPSQHHLSPEQYLLMQSHQLNVFIQQHQEQQEKQTDNQVFYPVDPPPHPMTIHPPHLMPAPQHQPPPFSPSTPIPVRFLPQSPPLNSQMNLEIRTCLSNPPPPPPPPPVPVQTYLPTSSIHCNIVTQDLYAEGNTSNQDFASSCEVEEHPLQDTWVMWFDKTTGGQRNNYADYQASLKQLSRVASIEQFWRLYNFLEPHKMEQSSNFHFFKEGIQPSWEDSANLEGGQWVFTVKGDTESLAKSWLEVLLLLIGGTVERSDHINGAVVSRRKKADRIGLWTNTRKEKPNLDICSDLVRVLLLAYNVPKEDSLTFIKQLSQGKNGLSLTFFYHRDSLRTGHSHHSDPRITLIDHVDVILQKIGQALKL